MELLNTVKRRTFWSEVVYYLFNIGLAIILLLIALFIQSPYPALVFVLLSKWRIVAVRPRFWWTNIQANLVDIIVGLGFVGLMYLPGASLTLRIILAILYAIWLTVIKPMSKRWQITLQAAIAIFIGSLALMSVSADWPVFVVSLLLFIIGYGVARHFLYSHEEERMVLLSLVWGVVFAELGWLTYFWNFSYPVVLSLKIPQLTIILILLSFLAERTYRSWKKHQHRIKFEELYAPVIFSLVIIFVMIIFFNSVVI